MITFPSSAARAAGLSMALAAVVLAGASAPDPASAPRTAGHARAGDAGAGASPPPPSPWSSPGTAVLLAQVGCSPRQDPENCTNDYGP